MNNLEKELEDVIINIELEGSDETLTVKTTLNRDEQMEMVKQLVEQGVDLNKPASTALTVLMWTAETGDVEIASFLIEHGALVNYQTGAGETALMLAAEFGNADVAQLLFDNGADPNIQNKYDSWCVV